MDADLTTTGLVLLLAQHEHFLVNSDGRAFFLRYLERTLEAVIAQKSGRYREDVIDLFTGMIKELGGTAASEEEEILDEEGIFEENVWETPLPSHLCKGGEQGGSGEPAPKRKRSNAAVHAIPERIRGTLKDFQIASVARMLEIFQRPANSGRRGYLLAHDMGLGKTVQTAALLGILMQREECAIVITPNGSICQQWFETLRLWAENLELHRLYRDAERRSNAKLRAWKRKGGVLITTYMTFQPRANGRRVRVSFMVLDEAHCAKTRSAETFKVLNSVTCPRWLLITGTPILNDLGDLATLFELVGGVKSDLTGFQATACKLPLADCLHRPCHRDPGDEKRAEEVNEASMELHSLLTKKEFMDFKTYTDLVPNPLSGITLEVRDVLLKMTPAESQNYFEDLGELLTRRQPMGDAPVTYHSSIMAIAASITRTQWEFIGARPIAYSCKLVVIRFLVDAILKEGGKVIVFTVSRPALAAICKMLMLDNRQVLVIRQETTYSERQDRAKRFNLERDASVMLISMGTGMSGLNLPGGSHVILTEPSWSPSKDAQAIHRAYRFGQTRHVRVLRLMSFGTVDVIRNAQQKPKEEMIRRVLVGEAGVEPRLAASDVERMYSIVDQASHDEALSTRTVDYECAGDWLTRSLWEQFRDRTVLRISRPSLEPLSFEDFCFVAPPDLAENGGSMDVE